MDSNLFGALFWRWLLSLLAFVGLFFVNPLFAFGAVFAAEVAAKLAMVTIVWVGKPTHKGLGSIFLAKAKKNLNAVAYVLAVLIVFPVVHFHWQSPFWVWLQWAWFWSVFQWRL